jgi:hypothetical protein
LDGPVVPGSGRGLQHRQPHAAHEAAGAVEHRGCGLVGHRRRPRRVSRVRGVGVASLAVHLRPVAAWVRVGVRSTVSVGNVGTKITIVNLNSGSATTLGSVTVLWTSKYSVCESDE